MNLERAFLIGFLGNYLINTVVAAIVALAPRSETGGLITIQYVLFVVLSALVVALLTKWYMGDAPRTIKSGVIFGVIGFAIAIITAFVTGVAGVLAQTGSFSAVAGVLPNFWPFIANWSTLLLVAYWIIPAAGIGFLMQPKTAPQPTM